MVHHNSIELKFLDRIEQSTPFHYALPACSLSLSVAHASVFWKMWFVSFLGPVSQAVLVSQSFGETFTLKGRMEEE